MASGVSVRYVDVGLDLDKRWGNISGAHGRIYRYDVPVYLQPFSGGDVSIYVKTREAGLKVAVSTSLRFLHSDNYVLAHKIRKRMQYVYLHGYARVLPLDQSHWIRGQALKYKTEVLMGAQNATSEVREMVNEYLTAAVLV